MTTEPKDQRGGDEAAEQRSKPGLVRYHLTEPAVEIDGQMLGKGWLLITEAEYASLSPSDPPPVREAVAWLIEHDEFGRTLDFQALTDGDRKAGYSAKALVLADPLPVSREAVEAARRLKRFLREGRLAVYGDPLKCEPEEAFDADLRAILALTGETSRE